MPCFRIWSNIANKYWPDKVDKILYKVINHDWFYMANDPECNYYFKVMNEETWNVPHRITYSEKMLEDHLMTFFRKKGISVEYDDVESLTEELSYFGVNAVLHRFEHKNLADWL